MVDVVVARFPRRGGHRVYEPPDVLICQRGIRDCERDRSAPTQRVTAGCRLADVLVGYVNELALPKVPQERFGITEATWR